MTLGSLFDGQGGWQLAAVRAGVKPLWSSEIERFPRAVTATRFPDTMQLGDITQIDGAAIPPVDIVTMGSPCQDLSIAGNRKGLDGERSGLFLRAVDVVRRMQMSTGGGDIPAMSYGRTSPVHSTVTRELIFEPCSKPSQKLKFQCLKITNGQTAEWLNATTVKLPGVSSTLDTGASPNVAVASSLLRILEPVGDVPSKYYLSKRACLGILRRARRRGKNLPKELRAALICQARWGLTRAQV